MSHWLEEAEREELHKRERPSRESAKVQDKIFRIRKNYEINKEAYEEFITYIFDLCTRANSLPAEKKLPWKIIDFKDKKSRFDNHLYYASTSESLKKIVKTTAFPFVKRQHYKHLRSVHFNISKKMNFAEIEIRDDYLAKTRLQTDETKKEKILDDGFPRVRVVFEHEIGNLNKDLALKILDWLAFKSDTGSLPFTEEQFKYDKRRK